MGKGNEPDISEDQNLKQNRAEPIPSIPNTADPRWRLEKKLDSECKKLFALNFSPDNHTAIGRQLSPRCNRR